MKLLIHITILVLISSPAIAQWQWALSADYNSASTGIGSHVLMHPNGNIVCTGSYSGGLALDNLYFSDINGSQFTAEFTPEGVPVRSFTIKETSAQGGANIFQFTRDSRGNMYYAGDIRGGVYFDTTLVNVGPNGYIVSIDTAFKYRWHKKVGEIVYSISFDNLNNLYPCGVQRGLVNSIDTFLIHNPDGIFKPKLYLAKMDSNFTCQWVRQSNGGAFGGWSKNGQGSLFIAGRVDSCTIYDTATLCPSSIIGQNFFLRTTLNGAVSNVFTYKMYGNVPQGFSYDIDSFNHLFIAGTIDTSVIINGQSIVKLPNSVSSLFISKIDTNLNVKWTKPILAKGKVYGSVKTNSSGFTYLYGTFDDTIYVENYTLVPQSAEDMFITRFSPQGQCLGIVTVPNALARSVTEDASGNAIVTGHIGPGNSQFGNITLSSPGAKNFFLAKLNALNGTSSITTLPEDGLLSIYANPNAGMFTVAVPEPLVNTDNIQLLIYGMSGELIKAEVANNVNNLLSVNLGYVKRGIYTVALQSGNKRYTGKVVVE